MAFIRLAERVLHDHVVRYVVHNPPSITKRAIEDRQHQRHPTQNQYKCIEIEIFYRRAHNMTLHFFFFKLHLC